jgi:hypothetical protein
MTAEIIEPVGIGGLSAVGGSDDEGLAVGEIAEWRRVLFPGLATGGCKEENRQA